MLTVTAPPACSGFVPLLVEIMGQYLCSYMVGQGPRRRYRGSAGVGRSRWVVTMPDLGGLWGRFGGRPNSSESPGNPVRFTVRFNRCLPRSFG